SGKVYNCLNRRLLPTVYCSKVLENPRTLEPENLRTFLFDGAVSNASAPPDSPRPDWHDRRHVRRDPDVRFCAERTVTILDFVTAGVRASRRAAPVRVGPPPLDRRSGHNGDGAEPRDSHSAVRPADSGYERGSGAIVLGAESHLQLLQERTDAAADELPLRRRHEHPQLEHEHRGRCEPAVAVGRCLFGDLEQLALLDDKPVSGLQSADRLEPEPAVHAAADA